MHARTLPARLPPTCPPARLPPTFLAAALSRGMMWRTGWRTRLRAGHTPSTVPWWQRGVQGLRRGQVHKQVQGWLLRQIWGQWLLWTQLQGQRQGQEHGQVQEQAQVRLQVQQQEQQQGQQPTVRHT